MLLNQCINLILCDKCLFHTRDPARDHYTPDLYGVSYGVYVIKYILHVTQTALMPVGLRSTQLAEHHPQTPHQSAA